MNAPPGFELFQESTLKKLRWIRAIKLNPDVASELEMAREMNDVSKKMLKLVKKELDSSRIKELPVSLSDTYI